MTPATSVSVAGCPTCPPCGRSASPPTGASWRCNESAATPPPEPTPTTVSANPSSSTDNEPPPYVSTPPPPKRYWPPWWSAACCPPGSPTATYEDSSPHCSGECRAVGRGILTGFANRDLRGFLAPLLGTHPSTMTQGRMSYHLRRLRLHGLIERIPATHRYLVTDFGLAAAVFLSRAHTRFTGSGLADLVGPDPPPPLRRAIISLNNELDRLASRSGLTA